ncbi:MAG: class I SAM-dependent methyltransferase [Myxococcota bacterium]|nr:class I SAM-dependent methyltransferase [Myxococcota bacterium]
MNEPASTTDRYRSVRERRHAFLSDSVARAYACRPPYPDEIFERLAGLLVPGSDSVLDAGCGPGKLARGLARRLPRLARIDAVDPSEAMLAAGRRAPGGDDPRVRFVHAAIEEAPLSGPYGLAVAGASVHWFDLDRALPAIARALAPGAVLAVMEGDEAWQPPWEPEELELFASLAEHHTGQRARISPRREPLPPILTHPLFALEERHLTAPFAFRQSVDDYIECQTSRSSLSRETLGPEGSAALADGLRRILASHAEDGALTYSVRFQLEWGRLSAS